LINRKKPIIASNGSGEEHQSFPGAPAGQTGLCWRRWPCPACSGGVSALGHLIRCASADPEIQPVFPEKIAARQIAHLKDWVDQYSHQGEEVLGLPQIGQGSEHIVFLKTESATVFKVTHPKIYGESYYIENDKMAQKNASPLDYLFRLRLWRILFGSAPRDLGITAEGQIVSSHEYILLAIRRLRKK
jgi:hypothetical protein